VDGTCGTHGRKKRCSQGFDWEARWKRLLGRPRRRWEYSIKMDLGEIGIDGANKIRLVRDRVQWQVIVSRMKTFGFHKESRLLFHNLRDYQLFNKYPALWSK